MFEVGQRVTVITDKGLSYDATIVARAKGDDGPGAYKVVLNDRGPEQLGQWHKAADVFLPERTGEEDEQESMDNYIKALAPPGTGSSGGAA
jgi:hypothetical protein